MTSKLPFGLKTKPTRKYFDGYSISFGVHSGMLSYTITKTTKESKSTINEGLVTTKEMLDKILKAESFSEILRLTQVVI